MHDYVHVQPGAGGWPTALPKTCIQCITYVRTRHFVGATWSLEQRSEQSGYLQSANRKPFRFTQPIFTTIVLPPDLPSPELLSPLACVLASRYGGKTYLDKKEALG